MNEWINEWKYENCTHKRIKRMCFYQINIQMQFELEWSASVWIFCIVTFELSTHLVRLRSIGSVYRLHMSICIAMTITCICRTCHCFIHQFQSTKNLATPFPSGLIALHTETLVVNFTQYTHIQRASGMLAWGEHNLFARIKKHLKSFWSKFIRNRFFKKIVVFAER